MSNAKHTPDRESELLADIEALTANRDSAVKERNGFLLQRDCLLEALNDALRSCRKDFPAGTAGESEFHKAYAEQFAAIAKATGAA